MKKNWLYLIPLSVIIIGCGTTDDDATNNGEGSIDLRTYLEKEDSTKNYQLINKTVGQSLTNQYYTETTTVTTDKVERKLEGITTNIINIEEKKLTITDVSDEGNIVNSFFRHVDLGNSLFSSDINTTQLLKIGNTEVGSRTRVGTNSCKPIEQLTEFTKNSHSYTGDILKTECTKKTTITTKVNSEYIGQVNYVNGTEDSVDISYYYQKKDTGLIASINNDCIPKNMSYPDDTTVCSDENKSYSHIYYLGN
jgi:hypothetical protein